MMEYDREYFTTGNYADYLQRKFDMLASDLVAECGLDVDDTIIDFGCGYGGLVHELDARGYSHVTGVDVSLWAIDYGRQRFPHIQHRLLVYSPELITGQKDHVLVLDVLEHIPVSSIHYILKFLGAGLADYLVARIPISAAEGEGFFLALSRNDPTHITCHCRDWWLNLFDEAGYKFAGDIDRKSIYSSDGVLAGKWVKAT